MPGPRLTVVRFPAEVCGDCNRYCSSSAFTEKNLNEQKVNKSVASGLRDGKQIEPANRTGLLASHMFDGRGVSERANCWHLCYGDRMELWAL